MHYQDFPNRPRAELEADVSSQDPERMRAALFSAMYGEPDWEWTQDVCLQSLRHADPGVRLAAAECLGYLARVRRAPLDFDRSVPGLEGLTSDPDMGFAASEALDDIEFIRTRPQASADAEAGPRTAPPS